MKRGFTLIELLVVIAIIGSLATIVIGAVNNGRSKAHDVKIKANLSNLRSQAGIYYTENGSYGPEIADGLCETGMFLDTTIANAISGVVDANAGGTVSCFIGDSSGGSLSDTWAVSSPLRTDALITWCTDSNGFSGEGTAQIVGEGALCQ